MISSIISILNDHQLLAFDTLWQTLFSKIGMIAIVFCSIKLFFMLCISRYFHSADDVLIQVCGIALGLSANCIAMWSNYLNTPIAHTFSNAIFACTTILCVVTVVYTVIKAKKRALDTKEFLECTEKRKQIIKTK